ncbi:MAG: hypothetical protein M3O31_14175 [Acidobacteriota bacterium]|nr:hypothetical protein [Acidobacteriota bacterium]
MTTTPQENSDEVCNLHGLFVRFPGTSSRRMRGEPSYGTGSVASLANGGAAVIYVIQNTSTGANNSILQVAANSNGTVSPASTLLPPSGMNVGALATDSSGQIYVAGTVSSQYKIAVYAAGATGSVTPLRTIVENNTRTGIPNSMAVDPSGSCTC